jgi:hypothetical protein
MSLLTSKVKSTMKSEYPLLKGYLLGSPNFPSYIPSWVTPVSWAFFALLSLVLAVLLELSCVGVALAGALTYGLGHLVRGRYKPRNYLEQADEAGFAALRKFKGTMDDGFRKKTPKRVLDALESAVEAHNTALVRVAAQRPHLVVEQQEYLQRCLHACFIAASTVLRNDQHSRKEWHAMNANSPLLDEIVGAIHLQISRMREPIAFDAERLAALQELQEDTAQQFHTS